MKELIAEFKGKHFGLPVAGVYIIRSAIGAAPPLHHPLQRLHAPGFRCGYPVSSAIIHIAAFNPTMQRLQCATALRS